MAVIRRRLGGAGTGKTTAQQTDMNRVREELGLSPQEIGATTFTRNGREVMAAKAAAAWGCGIDALTRHGWFRTVHSIAMKQLEIAVDEMLVGDAESMRWVSEAIGTEITRGVDENDEPVASAPTADSKEAALSLNIWNRSRSTLTPLADILDQCAACGDKVPSFEAAKAVVERYETAKRLAGRADFHDLLLRFTGTTATTDGFGETTPEGEPPAEVRAWFFDESQDASALVDLACRRLAGAENVEQVLLSGDAFQSVFGFGGSDYRHFLSWDAAQEIMPRSYRCPAVVMALGERCLAEMNEGYFDRQIAPAPHDGCIDTTRQKSDAVNMIDLDEPTLILSRCNYSLREYEAILNSKDIPWRHLKSDQSDTLAGFQALWELENGEAISHDQWLAALQVLSASTHELGPLLARGEKEAWLDGRRCRSRWDFIPPPLLEDAGCTAALVGAIKSGEWPGLVLPRYEGLASRWVASARRHGPDLATNPKISLSTIHSAKGAEGGTVLLSTETSKAIEQSRRLSEARHDEECRIAYVGVTRTRRRLIVVEDSGKHCMKLPL